MVVGFVRRSFKVFMNHFSGTEHSNVVGHIGLLKCSAADVGKSVQEVSSKST